MYAIRGQNIVINLDDAATELHRSSGELTNAALREELVLRKLVAHCRSITLTAEQYVEIISARTRRLVEEEERKEATEKAERQRLADARRAAPFRRPPNPVP